MRTSPYTTMGAGLQHRVPQPRAERRNQRTELATVPLRAHPWGRALVEHEERKRAMERQAAPGAAFWLEGAG